MIFFDLKKIGNVTVLISLLLMSLSKNVGAGSSGG